MAADYLSRDDYDRLSIASKDLVKAVGGVERALDITGYRQRPQIARCTTLDGEDRRFFTIKAIAEMESDAVESGKVPPVTKALANLAGFDLVRREQPIGSTTPLDATSKMIRAASAAFAAVTTAYADGVLDAEEQAECIGKLQSAIDEMQTALLILRGQKVKKED